MTLRYVSASRAASSRDVEGTDRQFVSSKNQSYETHITFAEAASRH